MIKPASHQVERHRQQRLPDAVLGIVATVAPPRPIGTTAAQLFWRNRLAKGIKHHRVRRGRRDGKTTPFHEGAGHLVDRLAVAAADAHRGKKQIDQQQEQLDEAGGPAIISHFTIAALNPTGVGHCVIHVYNRIRRDK